MAKYGSFSFDIGPSHEYSELVSFRIDWFDLLAVQGTVFGTQPFFMVQLSHLYVATGKSIVYSYSSTICALGPLLDFRYKAYKRYPSLSFKIFTVKLRDIS